MSALSLAATLLSGLIKLWAQFGSDTAILARLKEKLAEVRGRQAAEAAALQREYDRINSSLDLTGQALVNQLNETARKLRHKP